MKRFLTTAAVAVALTSGPALGAETGRYVLAGVYRTEQSLSTGKLFLDTGSRARGGDKVTVTMLAVFDTPVVLGRDAMEHSIVEMEIDCARKLGQVLRGGAYRADGTLISERSRPDEPSPPASDPDVRAMELACGADVGAARAFESRAEALTWARRD